MKKTILINSDILEYTLQEAKEEQVSFEYKGKTYIYDVDDLGGELLLKGTGRQTRILYAKEEHEVYLSFGTRTFILREDKTPLDFVDHSSGDDEGLAVSPMPGKILKILVSKGNRVKKGQPLIILEAMKMEHTIKSPLAATVHAILFKEGEAVGENVSLIELEKSL